MAYSHEQFDTLRHVKGLLNGAGLNADDLREISSSPSSVHSSSTDTTLPFKYIPPSATPLSQTDIVEGKGRITRTSSVQAIIEHPSGAIVEFPETGGSMNSAVGHIFPVNVTNFVNPKENIQYSLGDRHSIREDITCHLLRDLSTGGPVKCKQTKLSCRSIKHCDFAQNIDLASHPTYSVQHSDAQQEVFLKTLGFFCALKEQGCCIGSFYGNENKTNETECENSSIYSPSPKDPNALLDHLRTLKKASYETCKGTLLLEKDGFDRFFIRCEYYGRGTRGHLILRNIAEYNLDYLKALFFNDRAEIKIFEENTKSAGYGPLIPCTFTAACREQKDLCPFWHRSSNGTLQRGKLIDSLKCPSRFEIYQPYNLQKTPFILLVCRHPHSHPSPTRTKTPESILKIFMQLLDHLEWQLADATPRRILLDNAFISNLRQTLQWDGGPDPTLHDLHPSLGNFDHVARIINKLRFERYPHGTGLEGAQFLYEQHLDMEHESRYIRCLELNKTAAGEEFHIIICMYPAMSHLLLKTKRATIDTSFKRLHGWQEFEIEAYFPEVERSIVVARAFTTSQSSEAHLVLFRRLFHIVKEDTGEEVKFRHIHGSGIDTITADGHRGQALGLGLYLQEISQDNTEYCAIETSRKKSSLSPVEHLARCYRYCFAHYTRNISNLKSHVSYKVREAMMSLATSDPLPDLEAVFNVIRSGGKKAIDWLKDKQSNNGFALAGIYRPASKMSLDIWQAAPSTSNGNEQAHRNINRDGTKLTLLAGIMRGLQFDFRAIIFLSNFLREGIYSRDRRFTHFRRASQAIRRKGRAQEKNVFFKDSEIQANYKKVLKLQEEVQTAAKVVKHGLELIPSWDIEPARKRLRTTVDRLKKHQEELNKVASQGSGAVSTHGLLRTSAIFDEGLLERTPHEEHTEMPSLPIPPSFAPPSTSIAYGPSFYQQGPVPAIPVPLHPTFIPSYSQEPQFNSNIYYQYKTIPFYNCGDYTNNSSS